MRERLCAKAGGDRQFVTILATIAEDGIEAVNVACELALEAHAIDDSYVLNALNRLKPQPPGGGRSWRHRACNSRRNPRPMWRATTGC